NSSRVGSLVVSDADDGEGVLVRSKASTSANVCDLHSCTGSHPRIRAVRVKRRHGIPASSAALRVFLYLYRYRAGTAPASQTPQAVSDCHGTAFFHQSAAATRSHHCVGTDHRSQDVVVTKNNSYVWN